MSRYIDDFGEKIGGARKDLWGGRGLRISDLETLEEREIKETVTKENIWGTPDYKEYLDKGMEPVCIYFMKMTRDKLRARLNGGELEKESVINYIDFVVTVKELCEETKTAQDIATFRKRFVQRYSDEKGHWHERIYNTPGFTKGFYRAIRVGQEDIKELERECRIQNFPHEYNAKLKGVTVINSPKYGIFLAKQGEIIEEGFRNEEDAIEFARTVYLNSLTANKNKNKRKTVEIVRPQLKHIQRTGPDIRNSRNASTEHLLKMFGFRGGEFGNWNNQADRQAFLNYSFDAFADLAYVLDVPIGFISLGGYKKLAIAFGARGNSRAMAHYEPSRVVINLTKMRGAGCLAHEWAHAFDDFLGYKFEAGDSLSSAKHRNEKKYKNIAIAFDALMGIILERGKGKFLYGAKKLDQYKSKAYYSTNSELFARAFEAYVEDSLGFKSQYLVHSTKINYFEDEDMQAYPQGEQRERINEAFRKLMINVKEEFTSEYKPESFEMYKSNTDWDNKYDKNYKQKKHLRNKIQAERGQVMRDIENRESNKIVSTDNSNETINNTSELRKKLVDLTGEKVEYFEITLRQNLILVVRNKLKMGEIVEGNVPYNKARGNSKGWMVKNGTLVISDKESISKQIESIIEPVTLILTSNRLGDSTEAKMIAEGTVYMICKKFGLDVRSYCNTDIYEDLILNESNTNNYIRLCRDNFNYIFETITK